MAAAVAAALAGASPAQAEMTVIRNGSAIQGFQAPANSMWVGRLYVPAGATQLVVTTSGGRGDCDLYLRSERGDNRHWDFRSQSNSTRETIAIQRPKAGWWQVGLMAPGDYSGVTLLARFDEPVRVIRRPRPPIVIRDPNPHKNCPCGCRGDRHEHIRRHHRRRTVIRLAKDEFEPNSEDDMAMQIFEGRPQDHTIHTEGDEDWIMFVPRRSGRYVIEITNVTTDLEGELFAQSAGRDEKRIDKFRVRRGRPAAISLDVGPRVAYFKMKIEGEDRDDVGAYRLNVKLTQASNHVHLHVRRPDVYESDNKDEMPAGIKAGETQDHTIYPRDDEDWLLFAPTEAGEYLLKISNVTEKLKGELWVRSGDDKERKVDKFEVSRWGRTIRLFAGPRVRYFKVRLEADDNDETGDYRVSLVQHRIRKPHGRGRGPHRPKVKIVPPVIRHSETRVYTTPGAYGHRYRRHTGLGSILRGSLGINTGSVRIGVGVGLGGEDHRRHDDRHRVGVRVTVGNRPGGLYARRLLVKK